MLFDVVILIRYLHLPHIEVCCAGLHFFIIITLSLTLTELPNRTQLRENQLLTLLTVFSWSRSRFSNWSVLFSYNTPQPYSIFTPLAQVHGLAGYRELNPHEVGL